MSLTFKETIHFFLGLMIHAGTTLEEKTSKCLCTSLTWWNVPLSSCFGTPCDIVTYITEDFCHMLYYNCFTLNGNILFNIEVGNNTGNTLKSRHMQCMVHQ